MKFAFDKDVINLIFDANQNIYDVNLNKFSQIGTDMP